jgi:hypothetical protein
MSSTAQRSPRPEQTTRRLDGTDHDMPAVERGVDRPRGTVHTRPARVLRQAASSTRGASWLSTGFLGALHVRISALALSCLATVAAVMAARQPESIPYLVAGGASGLVLTVALALLCRAGLSSGSGHTSSTHPGSGGDRP